MSKGIIAALLLSLAPFAAVADTLEERVEAMERRNAELYHTLEEKKEAGLMTKITEKISISGLIEIEASFASIDIDGASDERVSDIVLASAQLGLEAELPAHFSGLIIFDYDDDESKVELDEATLDYDRGDWFARFGLHDVPFGEYPSHFITGSSTEELGETQETAIQVGYRFGEAVELAGWLANGDANENGKDDRINDMGLSVTWNACESTEVGGSLISDLADTDAEITGGSYDNRVGGWSIFATTEWGPLAISGEYLGAIGSFKTADLDMDGDGSGDAPKAWNVEVAAHVLEAVEVALRYDGSKELADAPKSRFIAGGSCGFAQGMSLSAEYFFADYSPSFSEDDIDRSHGLVVQLAAEF